MSQDSRAPQDTAPPQGVYLSPDYLLTLDGRDITPRVGSRLVELTLNESRGNEADQLEITLDDSDGLLALPPKGAMIALRLGWRGQALVDKGTYKVDEIEHSGAPDVVRISARSADMGRGLRQRAETSWHDTTLGQIVRDVAARNGLSAKVDADLAAIAVPHLDQTNESDMHLLSRLARQHDAACTVKKGRLVFLRISGARTAGGQRLARVHITRADGDQHRYHTAERTAYGGVQASWHDTRSARQRTVTVGQARNVKRLKDSYASEAQARAAAQAEMGRIERGKATMSLTLAAGRPQLMPQSPVTLRGFRPEIDATDWLIVKVIHAVGAGGYTTQVELETAARGAVADADTAPGAGQ